MDIVDAAERLFLNGNSHRDIARGSFDQIFAVIDRDQHASYREALERASRLNLSMTNDEGREVPFTAIPSNPCFELWLLLHFIDVHANSPCADMEARLKQYFPNYRKGGPGNYASTKGRLDDARTRAQRLVESSSPHSDDEPYTGVHILVDKLLGSQD